MGWGWLCCAKKRGFVAGFPQILGFFRLLDLKKRPLQNFHFATAPLLLPFIYTTGTAISRKRTHLPEFFHSYLPASVVFVLFRKEMILWHSADC